MSTGENIDRSSRFRVFRSLDPARAVLTAPLKVCGPVFLLWVPSCLCPRVDAMEGPPAVRRRRRAAAGVALVPLPRASRCKEPADRRRRKAAAGVALVHAPRASRSKKPVLPPPPVFVGYIASGLPKRKYDGFFPVLSSEVTAANRKKRKVIHDRWCGRTPDAPFISPLDPSWVGFTDEEVDILKDGV